MPTRNAEVVDLLQTIGDLTEVHGEEAFKARAYREAARQIDLVTEDIESLAAEGRLTAIKGIGASIARTIEEFLETGRSRQLETLKAQVPESLVELLGLRHFGPSRIARVHKVLGITSLDELEGAARDGRLARVSGFGTKSVETLLKSIAQFRQRQGQLPRYIAEGAARTALHSLRQMAALERVEIVGAMRRQTDTVTVIDLLAGAGNAPDIVEAFARLPLMREVERHHPWLAEGKTREQQPIRLAVVPPSLWAQGLQHFTGSDAHNRALAERARALGLGVADEAPAAAAPAAEDRPWPGAFFEPDGAPVQADDEAALYRRLGLPWIPPELREGRGEIARALAGDLPRLIELDDVRGDLHLHTTWSDGRDSIEQMARMARSLGREYIVIADHSPSLGVARGLTLERLAKQREEIARADAELDGIRVLSGVELDIKRDGTLDYPDRVLAQFDFVTASIHSGFQQPPERLTERVIEAMRSPHVDAIGHLTGRILGWREGLELDIDAILRVAAETGTALEINAWPNRLDVDEATARRAKELGIKLVISTDAHGAEQLDYMHYGVEIARRAWVEPGDVLNTLAYDQLVAYLRSRPGKGSAP